MTIADVLVPILGIIISIVSIVVTIKIANRNGRRIDEENQKHDLLNAVIERNQAKIERLEDDNQKLVIGLAACQQSHDLLNTAMGRLLKLKEKDN